MHTLVTTARRLFPSTWPVSMLNITRRERHFGFSGDARFRIWAVQESSDPEETRDGGEGAIGKDRRIHGLE